MKDNVQSTSTCYILQSQPTTNIVLFYFWFFGTTQGGWTLEIQAHAEAKPNIHYREDHLQTHRIGHLAPVGEKTHGLKELVSQQQLATPLFSG